jgi:WD40 repeat protein
MGVIYMTNKIKIFLFGIFVLIIIYVLLRYFNRNQILRIVWYQQQYGEVCSIAFSPDSQFCVSGGIIWDKEQNRKRSAIYFWQFNNGILKFILKGELDGYVNYLAFSPNGKLLASSEALWRLSGVCGSIDYLFKLWQISENTVKKLLEIYNENNPIFSPDGKFLATCSGLNISLWKVKKNDLIKIGELTGHTLPVTSIAFSPNGRFLATGDVSGIVKLWRLKDKSLIFTLKGHNDSISSITFSPNNILMVTGSRDGIIKLWYIKDNCPKLIQILKKHKNKINISFSPKGKFLVSCDENNIIIWKVEGMKLYIKNILNFIDKISVLSFSPDGKFLAVGSKKGFVYLYYFYEK